MQGMGYPGAFGETPFDAFIRRRPARRRKRDRDPEREYRRSDRRERRGAERLRELADEAASNSRQSRNELGRASRQQRRRYRRDPLQTVAPTRRPQRQEPTYSGYDRAGRTLGALLQGDAVGALDRAVNYRKSKQRDADFQHQQALDAWLDRRKREADINTVLRTDQSRRDRDIADTLDKRGRLPAGIDHAATATEGEERLARIATGRTEEQRRRDLHGLEREELRARIGAANRSNQPDPNADVERKKIEADTAYTQAREAALTGDTHFQTYIAAAHQAHVDYMDTLQLEMVQQRQKHNRALQAGDRRAASESFHEMQDLKRRAEAAQQDWEAVMADINSTSQNLEGSETLRRGRPPMGFPDNLFRGGGQAGDSPIM